MGYIRQAAIFILLFSFAVFVSLWGRLPVFRRTPIGFLYRSIWIYIPNALATVDQRLTRGWTRSGLSRTGHYLLYEQHPLVMIFFLLLLLGSECIFVPASLPLLASSFPHSALYRTLHYILHPLVITPPYVFLYLSYSTRSEIGAFNHSLAIKTYPFDYAIFHPSPSPINPVCRTCQRPKPARSKHCSICGACIEKADHHCIWINNCVGRNNYVYFLGLISSLSVLLAYGACLGYHILQRQLRIQSSSNSRGYDSLNPPLPPSQRNCFTSDPGSVCSWKSYMNAFANIIVENPSIGAPSLLAVFCFPLAASFTTYHIYLIWAGMTTNESAKWAELREDIAEGVAWRERIDKFDLGNSLDRHDDRDGSAVDKMGIKTINFQTAGRTSPTRPSPGKSSTKDDRTGTKFNKWPLQPRWVIVRMEAPGIRPPPPLPRKRQTDNETNDEGATSIGWTQIYTLSEVENIYDLGFWANLVDLFVNRRTLEGT